MHPYMIENVIGMESDFVARCDRVSVRSSSTGTVEASEVVIIYIFLSRW
jgi:hypothetical protein